MSICNIIMLTCEIIMSAGEIITFTCYFILLYVKMIMLCVDIKKGPVNIFIMQVDIIYLAYRDRSRRMKLVYM